MNTLVVEDDPTMSRLLEMMLRSRGHTVTLCTSAEEGWAKCQQEFFPLIMLDWMLPGEFDGLELCRRIRRLPNGDASVIMVSTSRNRPDDLRRVLDAGSDDYLAKPWTPEILKVRLDIIERMVQRQSYRKEVERQLRIEKERAERLAAEADRANRARNAFFANISHEIRTPLNAIVGFVEILSGLVQDPRQRKYLTEILVSARSLADIFNGILDLARIEAGKLTLEPVPTNLRAVLESLRGIFAAELAAKNIEMAIDVPPDLPPSVLMDKGQLRRVLVNLVDNAIRFTDRGRVTVGLAWSPAPECPNRLAVEITVADTGVGISAEQRETIFTPFRPRTEEQYARYGGAGMGLALSKSLVALMNGTIDVESELGRGTTFRLRLNQLEISDQRVATTHYMTRPVHSDAVGRELLETAPKSPDAVSPAVAVKPDAATLATLAEVADALEGRRPAWMELRATMTINDIETFGRAMTTLGAEYGYAPLTAWGERVASQATTFDMEGLHETLGQYPAIIEGIQALLKAG